VGARALACGPPGPLPGPPPREEGGARVRVRFAAAVAVALALPLCASAQAWPTRPVRIVVAGPAGGSADLVARILGERLAARLAQPVVVEPKPGAAGALAVGDLAQAAADGHTLLVGVNSLVSEVPHIVRLKVDMARELLPVAELARGGLVLVGGPAMPANDFAQLLAHVKSRPGQVAYASYSPGTLSHVLGLLLNRAAGLDMIHAGYKGSTAALADVMGGHVPLMFDGVPTSLPHLRSGRIRAYAVSTPRRSPLLPDVPTFRELGYAQLEAIGWMGAWLSPRVPAPLRLRVREAVLAAMDAPPVRDRLQAAGFEPGHLRSVDDMVRALEADHARVGAVLRSIDFKPE